MFVADYYPRLRAYRLRLRKIKRLIEFVVYGLFDILVLSTTEHQKPSNTIAIVHLKLLGDYMLWMPYGHAMVRYFKQRNNEVVLVLNADVLTLARRHFPDCRLIGINRLMFVRNLLERAKYLRQLRRIGSVQVYHNSYPRDAIIEDATVHALGGQSWGFEAVYADRPWIDRKLSAKAYHCLLSALPSSHQSIRHWEFLHALGIPFNGQEKTLAIPKALVAPQLQPYFVIAPGASRNEKCWPIQSFIAVANKILDLNSDWRCIVVGTSNEYERGATLVKVIGNQVRNLAGKTDLEELTTVIAHAELVIGNDSAACHIAAAYDVPSVAIVGGGHYGQFFPYGVNAVHVKYLPLTISKKMECFGCDWVCRYQFEKGAPYPCIEDISPEQVYAEVERLIQRPQASMNNDEQDANLRKNS